MSSEEQTAPLLCVEIPSQANNQEAFGAAYAMTMLPKVVRDVESRVFPCEHFVLATEIGDIDWYLNNHMERAARVGTDCSCAKASHGLSALVCTAGKWHTSVSYLRLMHNTMSSIPAQQVWLESIAILLMLTLTIDSIWHLYLVPEPGALSWWRCAKQSRFVRMCRSSIWLRYATQVAPNSHVIWDVFVFETWVQRIVIQQGDFRRVVVASGLRCFRILLRVLLRCAAILSIVVGLERFLFIYCITWFVFSDELFIYSCHYYLECVLWC